MSAPETRRGFLRGLTTLPLIGSGVALIGGAAAIASPKPEPMQTGKGCIMLDRLVFFDRRLKPSIGDTVLVIHHDGRLAVETVTKCYGEPGPGRVSVPAPKPRYASGATLYATLVGTVVGEGRP